MDEFKMHFLARSGDVWVRGEAGDEQKGAGTRMTPDFWLEWLGMMKSFTAWLTYERGLRGRFTEAAFSPGSRVMWKRSSRANAVGDACPRRAPFSYEEDRS